MLAQGGSVNRFTARNNLMLLVTPTIDLCHNVFSWLSSGSVGVSVRKQPCGRKHKPVITTSDHM